LKNKTECFNEEIEFNPDEHQLKEDETNTEMLEIVVKSLFRKAITEKSYCVFYGQICEDIMKLELDLMGKEKDKLGSMKSSKFRKMILSNARDTFNDFFNQEKRQESTKDTESKAIFEEKLFGNMEYVGELFNRRMLPIKSLIEIFFQLMGENQENVCDDLLMEACINLMNKVGSKFEAECKKKSKKTKADDDDNEDDKET